MEKYLERRLLDVNRRQLLGYAVDRNKKVLLGKYLKNKEAPYNNIIQTGDRLKKKTI